MTGPEHYRAAEGLVTEAAGVDADGYSADRDPVVRAQLLAEAQVHATLALCAALCTLNPDVEFGPADAWWQVAGNPSVPNLVAP